MCKVYEGGIMFQVQKNQAQCQKLQNQQPTPADSQFLSSFSTNP